MREKKPALTDKQYFPSLTGVRAIAAFMVYAHHFNPFSKKTCGGILYDFTNELHIGVTLFFVLSGFLIAYRYSEMNNFKFSSYILNRLVRIYPLYFILTTLTFIVFRFSSAQSNASDLPTYLLNVTFIKGFSDYYKFTGIAQGWSLTTEKTFYLIAPLMFVLIKRSILYLYILPVLLITFGLGLVFLFSKINFYGFFSTYEFMFNYTFFGRCFEFLIGIGLALLYKKRFHHSIFNYFTYTGILGIIASVYAITLFKGNADFGIRHPTGKMINTFILPLIGVSTFYYGLLKEKKFVSRILSTPLFVTLGKSSYIFYLIHIGIITTVLLDFTTNYVLLFIILNIISVLLFKTIEEPLNHYLKNKFRETGHKPLK